MTTDYKAFFLNSQSTVQQLETLEISHPNFSKIYWVVRNSALGITAYLEDGVTNQVFVYYPLQIKGLVSDGTLDQSLEIQLGDLGDTLPKEIDNIAAAGGFLVKPTVIYRTYRSDDLSAPMFGPITLNVKTLTHTYEGAAFDASAPTVNQTRTGKIYTLDGFPMLRAFL